MSCAGNTPRRLSSEAMNVVVFGVWSTTTAVSTEDDGGPRWNVFIGSSSHPQNDDHPLHRSRRVVLKPLNSRSTMASSQQITEPRPFPLTTIRASWPACSPRKPKTLLRKKNLLCEWRRRDLAAAHWSRSHVGLGVLAPAVIWRHSPPRLETQMRSSLFWVRQEKVSTVFPFCSCGIFWISPCLFLAIFGRSCVPL